MKIYFLGSISGKDKYLKNYKAIVDALESLGHKVNEGTINVSKEYVYEDISDDEKVKYYKQVLGWINSADVVVIEASHSSLSVGHELTLALEKNKPVVVLYSEGNAPHFLEGVQSERLVIEKYDVDGVKKLLKNALDYAADQQDTRFNFFISPRISNYLDWVARTKRLPRAVYLRRLIQENMDKNEEFQDR